jgi:CBS domain-containing protein
MFVSANVPRAKNWEYLLIVPSQDFPGIYTCTLNDRLDTIFDTIRKSRVHRLIVIDERSHLVGVLSLSDILDYTLNSPLEEWWSEEVFHADWRKLGETQTLAVRGNVGWWIER